MAEGTWAAEANCRRRALVGVVGVTAIGVLALLPIAVPLGVVAPGPGLPGHSCWLRRKDTALLALLVALGHLTYRQ